MRTLSAEYTFERCPDPEDDEEDEEITVYVDFNISRYYPATFEEPADGGEIEITKITIAYGPEDLKMTDAETEALQTWLEEQDWTE